MDLQSIPPADPEWDGRGDDPDFRFDPRVEPPLPSFLRSPRRSGVNDDHIGTDRPSIGWPIVRTLGWIFIPVLVGIGAGLAWQSRDAAARDMIVGQVQSLGGLLSTTKPPAIAATAPEPMQQLEPLASNFDIRRSVEQLVARQEQMAQNIALLQAVADDIREKMSTPPSSVSQQQADPTLQRYAPPARAPASAMQSSAVQSSAVQSSSVPRSPPAVGAALPSR